MILESTLREMRRFDESADLATMEAPDKEFVYQLTASQKRLLAFLTSLLGNVEEARDVLQETNLVLWQKMDEFEPGTNFGAWSNKVAYFRALSFIRDRKRDRHIFNDDLLARFAEESEAFSAREEEKELALRDCLSNLPVNQRQVISLRYEEDQSVKELAISLGKKESAMKMMLMRIRKRLFSCIETKMAEASS